MKKHSTDVCNKCGKHFQSLPFNCKYCSINFCEHHRLPEDHSCIGLEFQKGKIREKIAKGENITYEPRVKKEIRMKFDDDGSSTQVSTIDSTDITAPLTKGIMPTIGMIVAVIVLIGILAIWLM